MGEQEKWYERMRTFCKRCRQYDVVKHKQEEQEWCTNMHHWHYWSIKNCKNCGELSRHISPTANFDHGWLILCNQPTKNQVKNLQKMGQHFVVRKHFT